MKAAITGLALFLLFVLGALAPASAKTRVALVIGNSDYQHASKLKNPRNDAAAIAAALKRLDFDVLEGGDLDEAGFRRLVREFAVKLENAEAALFFYAGHGLQVNGRNYLLPVGAALNRELDLEFEAVPLELVLTQMERGQRTSIVLLDACRNNPLADNLARSMGTRSASLGRGLARVETGVGTYIGFSTQPENVALDGEGANSPFAKALLDNIETPDLDIETLMRKVREEVIAVTNGKQVPWGNSSLVGRGFVFKQAETVEPAQIKRDGLTTDQANIEIAYWNSIKDAGDPDLFEAYLAEYPNGRFVRLADIMIENLTAGKQAKPSASREEAEKGKRLVAVEPKEVPAAEKAPEDPVAEEAGFFTTAKGSKDQKLLEDYLKRYPKGRFVKEAQALLKEIADRQAAIQSPKDAEEAPKAKPKPAIELKPKAKVKAPPREKPQPVERRKKKPAVASTKPRARESGQCGWCTIGGQFNGVVCGAQYQALKARRRCGPNG
jgi:hypothetical protein